jgi:hypothetical protein
VRKILNNRAYVGDIVWNNTHQGKYSRVEAGEVRHVRGQRRRSFERNCEADLVITEDAHSAIIDRGTFAQAQAKLAATCPAWKGRRGAVPGPAWRRKCAPLARRNEWVLSGLLHCGDCGGPMTGRVATHRRPGATYTYRRYFCSATAAHGRGTCRASSVPEELVVETLAGMIHDVVSEPNRFAVLQAEIVADGDRRGEEARAALKSLDARVAGWTGRSPRATPTWRSCRPTCYLGWSPRCVPGGTSATSWPRSGTAGSGKPRSRPWTPSGSWTPWRP